MTTQDVENQIGGYVPGEDAAQHRERGLSRRADATPAPAPDALKQALASTKGGE